MTTATPATNTTDQVQRSIWRGIFGQMRGYLGLLSLKEGTKAHQEFFEYPEKAAAALAWLHREDAAGRNAYACAHLLQSKERTRDSAALVLALWADLDGCPLPTGELAPSIVIESSPGKFHCWWLLTKAITPERAKQLNDRLATAIGSDPSGSDLSQVLRIVGTHNHKPQYGTPQRVQLHTLSERRFDPDDLNRSLPARPAAARAERTPAAAASPATGSRPGDDYAARTDWAEILEPHGWTFVERRGDTDHWCRPGKSGAISATTDHDGSDLFYAFTSSTAFEEKRGYGKFSAYALLNHAGDHAAAAKTLAAAGYGSQSPTPIRSTVEVSAPAVMVVPESPCADQLAAAQARIIELERDLEESLEQRTRLRTRAEEAEAKAGDAVRFIDGVAEVIGSPNFGEEVRLWIGLAIAHWRHDPALQPTTGNRWRLPQKLAQQLCGKKNVKTAGAYALKLAQFGILPLGPEEHIDFVKPDGQRVKAEILTYTWPEQPTETTAEVVDANQPTLLSRARRMKAKRDARGDVSRFSGCPEHPDAPVKMRRHCSVCDRCIEKQEPDVWKTEPVLRPEVSRQVLQTLDTYSYRTTLQTLDTHGGPPDPTAVEIAVAQAEYLTEYAAAGGA